VFLAPSFAGLIVIPGSDRQSQVAGMTRKCLGMTMGSVLLRGGFHPVNQLLRGAVVVFTGELAEAGDGEVEFASHECGGGVGTTGVMLDALLELAC